MFTTFMFIVGFALSWFVKEKTIALNAWNKFIEKINS